MSTGEAVLFWIAGPLMVIGALGLVFARRAVYAALSMVMVMVLLGVLYLAMNADFLGVVQVFVYTGAIMMMFLFTIMLIGVDASESFTDTLRGHKWVAILVSLGLFAAITAPLTKVVMPQVVGLDKANEQGNVMGLAALIFGKYVWVFEVTSALLITAALAAMVLAHRERLIPRLTQKALAHKRVKENIFVAGLPAPGVYARHNAVDTPALLPDGSASDLSINRVLKARHQEISPESFAEAAEEISKEIQEGTQR